MLPSIVSQLVVILKDSALGFWINYAELIRAGQNLASGQANLIPTLIVLAAMFIAINYALTRAAGALEQRLRRSARGGAERRPSGSAGERRPAAARLPDQQRSPGSEHREHAPGQGLRSRADRSAPEPVGRARAEPPGAGCQRAVSVARDSRTTVTLI